MQMLTIALSQNGCMLSVMLSDLKNDPAFGDPFAAFYSQLSMFQCEVFHPILRFGKIIQVLREIANNPHFITALGLSRKVVRRKKSGLVDDHFEAVVPISKANNNSSNVIVDEESPPPCNCPRHFQSKGLLTLKQ